MVRPSSAPRQHCEVIVSHDDPDIGYPSPWDFELCELIDRLDTFEVLVLAEEFSVFATVQNSRVSRWARWWLWRIQRALGEHTQQPLGELVDVMYGNEREAIKQDLLTLAERHRLDDGVVAFSVGMVAQIAFRELDDEAERQDLQAVVDAYRRQHPHGKPRDETRRSRHGHRPADGPDDRP
jgi:hypothetical protein